MLLEGQGVACRVLRDAGLDVGTARESIIRLVGSGAPASMPVPRADSPLPPGGGAGLPPRPPAWGAAGWARNTSC